MPHRCCHCHHSRSTLAWFSQKTGSLGEVPASMSPPTQRCTRLCSRGPADHPSSRLRNVATEASHGLASYLVLFRASVTWAGVARVVEPLGSRPIRRTRPGVERATNVPAVLL